LHVLHHALRPHESDQGGRYLPRDRRFQAEHPLPLLRGSGRACHADRPARLSLHERLHLCMPGALAPGHRDLLLSRLARALRLHRSLRAKPRLRHDPRALAPEKNAQRDPGKIRYLIIYATRLRSNRKD